MRFAPRPIQPTLHPRKVRGGVKLSSKSGPVSAAWAGQRWFRLVEERAPNDNVLEGLEYARAGQTKTLAIGVAGSPSGGAGGGGSGGSGGGAGGGSGGSGSVPAPGPGGGAVLAPGHVQARVQGRMPSPYLVELRVPVFAFEQWDRVIEAMAGEARHLAGLLSGEVPPNVEDVFVPVGLRLFPQEVSDVAISCGCGYASRADGGPWCKHVCCVMALLGERLGRDPFLIFALRGISRDDLLDRLRERRALTMSRAGAASTARAQGGAIVSDRPVPAYAPRLPGVSDLEHLPLERALDNYWQAGADMRQVDLALNPPEVSHPLLRRLGSSPFPSAKFPLVGLLATCYDVISVRAREEGRTPEIAPEIAAETAGSDDGATQDDSSI